MALLEANKLNVDEAKALAREARAAKEAQQRQEASALSPPADTIPESAEEKKEEPGMGVQTGASHDDSGKKNDVSRVGCLL